MKQAIMKRWAKALRSGKYKQARLKLRGRNGHNAASNSFCCLGVLCDLFAQDHPNAGWVSKTGESQYTLRLSRCTFVADKTANTSAAVTSSINLPTCVQKWAGMKSAAGQFKMTEKVAAALLIPDPRQCEVNLVELNDEFKCDFSKIADVVEKHWRKL